MNNKWYSLTRPAVVQFNPPRDTVKTLGLAVLVTMILLGHADA